jgi:succinoglycan biosynthesis transport protein ExoP
MKFHQVLLILRARYRIVLAALLLTVAASIAINLLLPKKYEAATTLVVNYKGSDPVSGTMMPSAMMTGYMATQVDIIQSKTVALGVVGKLGLAEKPESQQAFARAGGRGDMRNWLADALIKSISVVPARESSVVNIIVKGSNPAFAAQVANAFAAEYQETSIRLKVQPLKQAAAYFNAQSKDLRDKLAQAQARLSTYQQENGLVSVDQRLDVESARLNELSSQLVLVQSQAADASSRRNTAQGIAGESPDVVANPLVQAMKSSLAQSEAKLAELGQRLDVNHPQYQGTRAEVDRQRAELATQMKIAYGTLGSVARNVGQRQAQLESAVATQKARILELNSARDKLAVLAREVDSAQRTFDAASARFSQTSIEGGANQTDIAVLSAALAPLHPSSPRMMVNVILSIIFGTAFGIALALLLEMARRRIYCADDVIEMHIPVLADWRGTHQKRRGMFGRRRPARGRLVHSA